MISEDAVVRLAEEHLRSLPGALETLHCELGALKCMSARQHGMFVSITLHRFLLALDDAILATEAKAKQKAEEA